MKLRHITESDYDGLEDADEFTDDVAEWQQDNYGPVKVGPYLFTAHTMYEQESRDIDSVIIFVRSEAFEKPVRTGPPIWAVGNNYDLDKCRWCSELDSIKDAILAEYPKYEQWFQNQNPQLGSKPSILRDAIQDIAFAHYKETVPPDMDLWNDGELSEARRSPMKLKHITESDYAGLEDADEFGEPNVCGVCGTNDLEQDDQYCRSCKEYLDSEEFIQNLGALLVANDQDVEEFNGREGPLGFFRRSNRQQWISSANKRNVNESYEGLEDADEFCDPDAEYCETCPDCGERTDYCQGHGSLGPENVNEDANEYAGLEDADEFQDNSFCWCGTAWQEGDRVTHCYKCNQSMCDDCTSHAGWRGISPLDICQDCIADEDFARESNIRESGEYAGLEDADEFSDAEGYSAPCTTCGTPVEDESTGDSPLAIINHGVYCASCNTMWCDVCVEKQEQSDFWNCQWCTTALPLSCSCIHGPFCERCPNCEEAERLDWRRRDDGR